MLWPWMKALEESPFGEPMAWHFDSSEHFPIVAGWGVEVDGTSTVQGQLCGYGTSATLWALGAYVDTAFTPEELANRLAILRDDPRVVSAFRAYTERQREHNEAEDACPF